MHKAPYKDLIKGDNKENTVQDTEKIYDNPFMLQFEVKMKISGILKYLFPITVNIYKMQSTVNETGCLFENRMKRAPWVIEKVQ